MFSSKFCGYSCSSDVIISNDWIYFSFVGVSSEGLVFTPFKVGICKCDFLTQTRGDQLTVLQPLDLPKPVSVAVPPDLLAFIASWFICSSA